MPANSAAYQKQYRADRKAAQVQVSVTLSLGDHQVLKSYARTQWIGLATLLRETGLAEMQSGQRRSKQIENDLWALRRNLSGVANNLNQMARNSNGLRQVLDHAQVLACLRSYHELLDAFVDAKLAHPWSWNLSAAKQPVLPNWWDTWPDIDQAEIMSCVIISAARVRKVLWENFTGTPSS